MDVTWCEECDCGIRLCVHIESAYVGSSLWNNARTAGAFQHEIIEHAMGLACTYTSAELAPWVQEAAATQSPRAAWSALEARSGNAIYMLMSPGHSHNGV